MLLFGTLSLIPQAFGCSRAMSYLFWSPIINRVSRKMGCILSNEGK